MRVEVFSFNAAVSGSPSGTMWRGEVRVDRDDEQGVLDLLFRYFNVVDDIDRVRLIENGYELPSLSVGDYITIHGAEGPVTYRVAVVGFKKITGNTNLLFDLVRRTS